MQFPSTNTDSAVIGDTKAQPCPAPLPARRDSYPWQLDAACRGMNTELFFHPAGERSAARKTRIDQATTICRICPVATQCLDQAQTLPEPYGIWGGHSESERAQLLGVVSLRYPGAIQIRRSS